MRIRLLLLPVLLAFSALAGGCGDELLQIDIQGTLVDSAQNPVSGVSGQVCFSMQDPTTKQVTGKVYCDSAAADVITTTAGGKFTLSTTIDMTSDMGISKDTADQILGEIAKPKFNVTVLSTADGKTFSVLDASGQPVTFVPYTYDSNTQLFSFVAKFVEAN